MNSPYEDPVGKTVIIGLSYFNESGRFISQKQCHGRIHGVTAAGVEVELSDGDVLLLPCGVCELQVAPPGEYRETSTGKVVQDPAFITMWDVRRQSGGESVWERGPDVQFPGL